LTSIKKGTFICENKENEFPEKIEYKSKGNIIKAIISSEEMQIPFDFKRLKSQ